MSQSRAGRYGTTIELLKERCYFAKAAFLV